MREVEWLGYHLSESGIKPAPGKVEKIRTLRSPTCLNELRQVLGVVNYYARYVPKLAAMASPLHELLKKTTAWKWGSKEEEALDRLKESICRDQALVAFDSSRDRKTYLTCDASETGMGAVLEQRQDDNERKPVITVLSVSSVRTELLHPREGGLSLRGGYKKVPYLPTGETFHVANRS